MKLCTMYTMTTHSVHSSGMVEKVVNGGILEIIYI